MPKTPKTKRKLSQKDRFISFKNGQCTYCGASGAKLTETKRGYHGECIVCHAQNNFSNPKVKGWVKE